MSRNSASDAWSQPAEVYSARPSTVQSGALEETIRSRELE